MDPSEFEGTLSVEDQVLTAGGLETLLATPKFEPLDLSKEIDAIHLTVYNLTESLGTWRRINFGALLLAWDEQALKISDNKNDSNAGRKVLATKVKAFTTAHLGVGAGAGEAWRAECEELIALFKAHVDALAGNSRFAEAAFLSTYKLMTSAEDPSMIIGKCLETCVMAQEALKAAQDRLAVAEQVLSSSESNANDGGSVGVSSSVGLSFSLVADREKQEKQEKQHAKDLEEREARHSAELQEMRSRFDIDLRSREQLVRSDLERAQMELQQHFESLLERKEAQLGSLLASVNDSSQRAMEAEERGISLQQEVSKRRELEERLRTALTELADSGTHARELQTKFEDAFARVQALEAQGERDAKKSAHDLEVANAERSTLREALQALEAELAFRPPADLAGLAHAMGVDLLSSQTEAGGGSGPTAGTRATPIKNTSTSIRGSTRSDEDAPPPRLQWSELEPLLKDSLRRSHSAAAEARGAEQEATSRLSGLVAELSRVGAALENKEAEVAVLERDLVAAHRLLEGNKALMRVLPQEGDVADELMLNQTGGAVAATGRGTPVKVAASSALYQSRLQPAVSGSPAQALASPHHFSSVDLEKGAGGAGAAALLVDPSTVQGSDRMQQAILSQRDRFMKLARDRESELATLKSRFDKLQEEQLTLRQDNLELYRRQRAMRGGNSAGGGEVQFDNTATPSKDKARPRRDVRINSVGGGIDDSLDAKYSRLYESHIDPFKFEEADRAIVISRLNPLERGLANISRFLLQDRWTRHALVVYLLLVHFFALGYVIQVLNPQLVDEVDYYSREKFAKQTLDNFEIEPDW